jgi:hypothetical protein
MQKEKWSYPCNRPWLPMWLWDVKDPTLSRQSGRGRMQKKSVNVRPEVRYCPTESLAEEQHGRSLRGPDLSVLFAARVWTRSRRDNKNWLQCCCVPPVGSLRLLNFKQKNSIVSNSIKVAWWLTHYATSRKVGGSRLDKEILFFPIYLIFPVALGSGVYSTSNRNEYQKQKNNVSGE